MFKKILIANRGEIAVRIMATCREMGICAVAVYSEADRYARHVREADEAYFIGPAPAAESYLRIDTLLNIAKQSGAEAIHPGYGFLSENPMFAQACEQANIIFIGPSADTMRLMGSKIAAKQLAQSVGAPIVPGYNGESQDDETLQREAQHIGFPLLIKASAGGGGKGMRIVHSAVDFLEQLAGARREAQSAFGDDMVFLERLIQQPRHVEVQILGDKYGNLIHLGERDCSIQRRHQKIIEESPCVALTQALRAEMGSTAVRIAKAALYVNAGTIEFILDADKRFYFLEMNTRLQVEHPVTELVTGLDLVRHQLYIAAGEPLSISQQQINQHGHAIEVRVYAEDSDQNFLPSTGTITRFVKPEGPGIRVDSGIESGDEITQYYDPMIAKLIVYGEDRSAAITRLQRALERCAILGVTTNAPLLHTISLHPAFQEGLIHTSFLSEHILTDTNTLQKSTVPNDALIAAALYEVRHKIERLRPSAHSQSMNPWHSLGPWRMVGGTHTITYNYDGQEYKIMLKSLAGNVDTWNIQIDTQPAEDILYTIDSNGMILLQRGPTQTRAYVEQQKSETQVVLAGHLYRLQRKQAPDVEQATYDSGPLDSHKTLNAPMAGTIVKVYVHDGDIVEAHQVLVVLSAMKMEHTIKAPYAGKIQHVYYQEGAIVAGGAIIVEFQSLQTGQER